MKKAFTFILTILLLITPLTACSSNKNSKSNSSENASSEIQDIMKFVNDNADVSRFFGDKNYTLIDAGTIEKDGHAYFSVAAGKNSDDGFSVEVYYYVEPDYSRIYEYDIPSNTMTQVWEKK